MLALGLVSLALIPACGEGPSTQARPSSGEHGQRHEVIIYTTAWCKVCRRAKDFMRREGIAFVERDVERSREAKRELDGKKFKAGLAAEGVPVFDVGGRLLPGFDEAKLKEALQR